VFTPEELAGRLMPCVCQRLVDADPSVADAAFNALRALEQHVRQEVEDRRKAQSMEPILGDQTATVGVGDAASLQGRLGSWASTVGNMVGQKIMGSMKTDGSIAPANPARTSSSSDPGVTSSGEGMSLRPKEAAAVSGFSGGNMSNAWESPVDLETEAADPSGSGWGDFDLDEFKDLAADPPPPRAESMMESAPPAASTGPCKGSSAVSLAPKSMSMGPSPTTKTVAPASKTKAKAEPQKDGILPSDDSDFWKEFDM